MKTRSFEELAQELLTKEQIKESKAKVKIEAEIMRKISHEIERAMKNEGVGFNELVRKLGTSPTQVSKILKGNANLTLNSLFKICSALGIEPIIKFKKAS